jgi:2-isopropylmalate synthase
LPDLLQKTIYSLQKTRGGEKMQKQILLNDVSLREGAQVAGGAMSQQDQLTYIQYLADAKIDRMEIGFPGSSAEQKNQCSKSVEFVKKLSGHKPLLAGLARAVKLDIDAVTEVGCDICHIYIPSSDSLLLTQFDSEKYGNTPEEKKQWVTQEAFNMVKYAKSLGFKFVQYSPEDAARTSKKYLCKIVEAVIQAGADIVNIPDTTGLRIGSEFGDLIKYLFEKVSNIHNAIISVHCHNDSDHSTNNVLQAILAGAQQVEGTFYGIGERSGMTKFEALLMNLTSRPDIFADYKVKFNKSACLKIVNFVGNALGMPVPRHWVVVGAQNAICNSGTHQAIETRATQQGGNSAYYSWNPELYGHIGGVQNIINQSSGKKGLSGKLIDMGYCGITQEQIETIFERVKKLSEAKAGENITERELTAIVQDVITKIPFPIIIEQCQAIGGQGSIPTATLIIKVNDAITTIAEFGDGPYDAIMKAVQSGASKFYPKLKTLKLILDDWMPIPITKGRESLADVYVRIKIENGASTSFSGKAVHIDTNQATAQAFANCLSWILSSLEREKKE